MRRLFVTLAVVGALALALAAPALAAPAANPHALTYTVTCGNESFDVTTASGLPGWPKGPAGTTPDVLMGGDFTLTAGSDTLSWATPVPPGLADTLQTCRVEGPLEATGFHLVIDPAYLLRTPR